MTRPRSGPIVIPLGEWRSAGLGAYRVELVITSSKLERLIQKAISATHLLTSLADGGIVVRAFRVKAGPDARATGAPPAEQLPLEPAGPRRTG